MSSRQALVLGLLLAAAMLMVRYAAAHHSLGTFDTDEQIRLEGEVVAFEWTNPHTWTWLDVTNSDGSVTRWGLEGMSPGFLGRRGWTRRTLQPGDRVEILVAPLKSGEPGGTFLRVTLPDGTEKLMFGGR